MDLSRVCTPTQKKSKLIQEQQVLVDVLEVVVKFLEVGPVWAPIMGFLRRLSDATDAKTNKVPQTNARLK